ncbi:MAG: hypothetical protein H6595_09010 [Flavobacteriales bacterium]|nr:hypothetical protein [Flavobacteriales bacterium]MCB9167606.1 hypothetical protein [Flavobacteriales bacterium]
MSGPHLIGTSALVDGRLLQDEQEVAIAEGPLEEMLRGLYQTLTLDYPKFHKMDAVSKLGLLLTEPLVRMAREHGADITNDMAIAGMGRSGCSTTDQEHWRVRTATGLASPAVFVYTLPNIGLGEITIRHKVFGPSVCLLADRPDAELFWNTMRCFHERDGTAWAICYWSDIFADRYEAKAVLIGPGSGRPLDQRMLRTLFDIPT